MAISWTTKKQLVFIGFFVLIVVVVLGVIFYPIFKPTCSDGRKNQDEEGIDCGGVCGGRCIGIPQDVIVLWSKPFKVKDGVYEAAALINNPNIFLGTKLVKYKFKLYDSNNILITIKDGETFLNPGEKNIIFETNINTGQRVPQKAFIEFDENINWEIIEKKKPQLIVVKKDFVKTPIPKLTSLIKNELLEEINDINVVAVIFDSQKNAIAVSSTKIDSIGAESSNEIVFSWPADYGFDGDTLESEIFLRTNLTQ